MSRRRVEALAEYAYSVAAEAALDELAGFHGDELGRPQCWVAPDELVRLCELAARGLDAS